MRVGLAGLGNVGAGTLRLVGAHADLLEKRAGQPIEIVAVSARSRSKARDCDLDGIDWVEDPRLLAIRQDIDVVVEVIGGVKGIALELAQAALGAGKHLVTANKAMIAAHGIELAKKAEKAGVQLVFEAAVCGGVPILKTLREGLAANQISSLRGILNGTCNYILNQMGDKGMDFATALDEAQRKGYAEADPTDDIGGFDTANKLAILSALAFGIEPDLSAIFIEGIRDITQGDLRDASARGGRIKLLGIANFFDGKIIQRVQPIFVPLTESLAQVGGASNAIELHGDFAGEIFLSGVGAGGDATASSVVSDLIDIARGNRSPAFGTRSML